MARVKIGEAVTDANGIAVFEYTGTGSGLMDVRAVNGNVQSTPYGVWDTLWFDNCTDNSKASMWHVYQSTVSTPSFSETGMFVERTSTGNGYLFVGQSTERATPFALDFAVEFDVVAKTGDVRFSLGSGSWNAVGNMSANDHYKIEYCSDKEIVTKNNGTPVETTHTNSGNFKCQFQFVGVSSITLRNVKVYSI